MNRILKLKVLVVCKQSIRKYIKSNLLARAPFRVLLSRDFSRVPQMESLIAGYIKSCILVSYISALCVATQCPFYFFAKTSGIITGDAPVSYRPIFSRLPSDSPRSLRESLLSPASVSFLKGRMTTQRNAA